jgi:hypothetical protein
MEILPIDTNPTNTELRVRSLINQEIEVSVHFSLLLIKNMYVMIQQMNTSLIISIMFDWASPNGRMII